MSKQQVILQVLRDAGVYQQAREKTDSDQELVDLFCNRFDELVQLVSK